MNETPSNHRNSAERRRAIAAAARAIIADKGFEGLRTREIADRVGINIATLHYHIPTKEALVELVARSLAEDFCRQDQRHRRDGETPLERLRGEFRRFRELRETDMELLKVMEELARRACHDENIARHIVPMRRAWLNRIAEILVDGRDDGTFRADLDPEAAAVMVTGTMILAANAPFGSWTLFDKAMDELVRSLLSSDTKAEANA